jgi:hypothetical protein
LEGRREEVKFTQFRRTEQIGFTAKISKASRGLGTDDGDSNEFKPCRKLLVAPIETGLLEFFPDPGQFGSEITEGIGRVNVFNDEIETVEGIEANFRQAENLDVGFYSVACRLLELGCDRFLVSLNIPFCRGLEASFLS